MSTKPHASYPVQQLYQQHHGWLYHWLKRKLNNSCDAADLAQDTFVRLLSSSRNLSQLGQEPRALLTHIAKGLVIDQWRRRQVEQNYLEALAHLPHHYAPSAEQQFLILEALIQVDKILRDLPEITRTIFLLSQIEAYTYQEIATFTGLALITVKRHMRTAFGACLTLLKS